MIASPLAAALWGALAGACTGLASRWALKKALGAPAPVFYSVFVGGIFVRLALVAAGVCLLRHEKYIIIILFAAAMILVQMFFEAFPLKKNGSERDT